jgi:hypothetical protein
MIVGSKSAIDAEFEPVRSPNVVRRLLGGGRMTVSVRRRPKARRGRIAFGFFLALVMALAAECALTGTAAAYTLLVGPGRPFLTPSAAARVAMDGDTIKITPVPGGYYDCAIWSANHLIIEGEGQGAVLTDMTCQGKAIFVVVGNDTTIRNLTFARARVPSFNGAGIRAEGTNLRVENSRFINNESGILAASAPDSTITIVGSEFIQNGKCYSNHCTSGVTTGDLAALNISRSIFSETKGGGHISSGALSTELADNQIADGEAGTAAYLVELPNGGSLVMRNNRLTKGLHSSNPGIAIKVMAGFGAQPVRTLLFEHNSLRTDGNKKVVFVFNWSRTRAKLNDNTYYGAVKPSSSDGYTWFAAKSLVRYALESVKAMVHASLVGAKALAHKIINHL